MRTRHAVRRLLRHCMAASAAFWLGGAWAVDLQPRSAARNSPVICIIIDDLGYRKHEGLRALALPGPVTYSVLPHTPFGQSFARRAFESRREVLLHLPMEPLAGIALEPGTLMLDMTESELDAALDAALAAVPHATGISNHMGSLLTTRPAPMHWLMRSLAARHAHLFFVDSRTVPGSLIPHIAAEHGVTTVTRDIFLDHSFDAGSVRGQFEKLVARARAEGTALAIGHPRAQTLSVLEEELRRLPERGVRLVSISELLERRTGQRSLASLREGRARARSGRMPHPLHDI